MAPAARSKFDAPMFEPEVFRKQMHCTEESRLLATWLRFVGALRSHSAPHSNSVPGQLCPLCPLATPLVGAFEENHEHMYPAAANSPKLRDVPKTYITNRCTRFSYLQTIFSTSTPGVFLAI